MNELLNTLLESEILTADSKKALEEAFASQTATVVEATRMQTADQVRVELTEQWVAEKANLVEAIDAKLDDYLMIEMQELRDDIAAFRDLEVEYSQRLSESKKAMGIQLESDMLALVDKLDSFLDVRLNEEFAELKADLAEAKKLDFGRRIFEAFEPEYRKHFVNADKTEKALRESKASAEKLRTKLAEATATNEKMVRAAAMSKVLAPLTGDTRGVMESLLTNVPNDRLEESYSMYIGRVLKTNSTAPKAVNESVTGAAPAAEKPKLLVIEGNEPSLILPVTTGANAQVVSDYKKLAGL